MSFGVKVWQNSTFQGLSMNERKHSLIIFCFIRSSILPVDAHRLLLKIIIKKNDLGYFYLRGGEGLLVGRGCSQKKWDNPAITFLPVSKLTDLFCFDASVPDCSFIPTLSIK